MLHVTAVHTLPLLRAGVHAAVAMAPDLEWTEEAAEAAVLVTDTVASLQPIECRECHAWRDIRDTQRVVWLAPEDADDDAVVAAVTAGVRGCVPATAGLEDLQRAIRAVGDGHVVIAAPLAAALARRFVPTASPLQRAFPALTDRERDVLAHLTDGHGIWETAQALDMAPKTVRNHISRIGTKLQVVDRTQLVLKARAALA